MTHWLSRVSQAHEMYHLRFGGHEVESYSGRFTLFYFIYLFYFYLFIYLFIFIYLLFIYYYYYYYYFFFGGGVYSAV